MEANNWNIFKLKAEDHFKIVQAWLDNKLLTFYVEILIGYLMAESTCKLKYDLFDDNYAVGSKEIKES